MTLCFLVRHAHHSGPGGVLMGRSNPPLSEAGKTEAAGLAQAFKAAALTHVISSPSRRALETASVIARAAHCKLEIAYALDEIDYGAWTGRHIRDLDTERAFRAWVEDREDARPPSGESMREVQARVVTALLGYASRYPNGRAAMVSHAEPIRAAELFCRGLGLGCWQEIDVPEASVTTIAIGQSGQMVVSKAAAA